MILFWSSLGSLAMAGLGLYTLATSEEMRGARSGREIPDNQTEELAATTMEHREDDTHAVLHHNRLFEGALEWLIATLISLLGILATGIVIKVTGSHSVTRVKTIFYRYHNTSILARYPCCRPYRCWWPTSWSHPWPQCRGWTGWTWQGSSLYSSLSLQSSLRKGLSTRSGGAGSKEVWFMILNGCDN